MLYKTYYIGFSTIIRKEFVRFIRIWVQTLLPSAITTALYFLIFGKLLGSQIGDINGVSYIKYIAPGLIMLSVITNSYSNVVGSFFSIRFQKSVEELLVAPLPTVLILLGFTFGGVLRGLVIGFIVTLIALFFTHLQLHNFWVTFSVIFLSALLFSLAGFANALYAKKFDDISIVPTFILTPLTYLGGIFYSITLLPKTWQYFSMFNPILYMVDAFRYGVLGVSDIPISYAYLILVLCCSIIFSLNLYLLNKGTGIRT